MDVKFIFFKNEFFIVMKICLWGLILKEDFGIMDVIIYKIWSFKVDLIFFEVEINWLVKFRYDLSDVEEEKMV